MLKIIKESENDVHFRNPDLDKTIFLSHGVVYRKHLVFIAHHFTITIIILDNPTWFYRKSKQKKNVDMFKYKQENTWGETIILRHRRFYPTLF
jgi:hypothetical protein